MPFFHHKRDTAGFTLVELIAAMALLSLVSLFLVNIINNTEILSNRLSNRLEAIRIGRECLDLIERDLQRAALPYHRSAQNTLQLVANPKTLPAAYANPQAIFWQAPLARDTASGNISIIGYYVIRYENPSNPRANRYELRRLYIEPTSSNYRIYSNADWYSSLLPQFAPATAEDDYANGQRGWVSDGVLALWVRCLDLSSTPITRDAAGNDIGNNYDSRLGMRTTGYKLPDGVSALPAYIEVGLTYCAPADVPRISTFPTAPLSGDPARFHREIQAFTTALRTANPGAKSIYSVTRKIRLYSAGL